jgi:hypothetical protein
MVYIVITLNLLIASLCFYVAWRLWTLKLALTSAADALVVAERATHRVLSPAPGAVIKRQEGIYHLRQHYHRLEIKLERVQKILSLLGLGRFVWQWYMQRSAGRQPAWQRLNFRLKGGRKSSAML